jgi:SAM-dependent methyltransferase
VNPKIICPTCGGSLKLSSQIFCPDCNEEFPVYNRTPVLLSNKNDLFNKELSIDQSSSGFNTGFSSKISNYLPGITLNTFQDRALQAFINNLDKSDLCLVVGAGFDKGLKSKLLEKSDNVIVTDVITSPLTDYVCDVTNLPFANNQFDAVFVIAVLEHVVEPQVAVSEISRVLRYDGRVFSSIPFMQQVHMGCYDFTRYTLLGHRWLFKSFSMVDLAPSSGSGTALLWSITSFFRSFTIGKNSTLIIKSLVRILLFWIKYFDLLQKNSGDFASGTYFVGLNKKAPVLDKKELVNLYNKK